MEARERVSNIHDVTDYIIGRFADDPGSLNVLKLQKLLYYVQAWHLAFGAGVLFIGGFQAWVHGPANREIYDRFKTTHTMFSDVNRDHIQPTFRDENLSKGARRHIDEVLEAYGELSGIQLEHMTHDERPWIEARGALRSFERCETVIKESSMERFYRELLEQASEDDTPH
ncbi:Panacea domain-containing protein [Paracoccus saliphilus]|uniref:DUF4065 domain-containing protein n=1 Tax=Paracoccus saliphilus TaxID=405559 RepID=A0AA45W8M5_9RHOB|nr:type II toxin-antitoxin system antitoxin SocA domain-containing protein [Paracoccus saliphilus]WCR04840.1 DUF4065 domain-containing protein [Paracoccus saliphilus]SIT17928.1 Uncharacterized phage-associated protein [Paracoccus saliphilus]